MELLDTGQTQRDLKSDFKNGGMLEMNISNSEDVQGLTDHIIIQTGCKRKRRAQSDDIMRISWRELSYEFTQYTTLHGLRYIAHRDTFILRRIFWLLLTLTCSGLLVVQIVDRVQYLLRSPVAVNIKVNYNQSLQFPAITICNQNAFRATAAKDLDLYRLIEMMYHERNPDSRNTTWLPSLYWNISMKELYTKLGHTKEDFIVSCSWSGEECSAENFSTTLTDHGMCYTFNAFDEEKRPLDVTLSGAEHGLKLTLNAERYNAMPGPHDATGIKLLATAQSEFPRVEEVGIAIPTGAHAFVGLNVLVINNLPKPHGDCDEKTLVSTPRYSPEMCVLECVTRYVGNHCGCRNVYMPRMKEYWKTRCKHSENHAISWIAESCGVQQNQLKIRNENLGNTEELAVDNERINSTSPSTYQRAPLSPYRVLYVLANVNADNPSVRNCSYVCQEIIAIKCPDAYGEYIDNLLCATPPTFLDGFQPNVHRNIVIKCPEDFPVCTVKQYFDCYLESYEYIHKRTVDECECPTSCNYILYETSISYATTSAKVKGTHLNFTQTYNFQSKFHRAREITSKMNRDSLRGFQATFNATNENYRMLRHLFSNNILQRLQYQMRILEEWRANVTSSGNRKQTIFEFQEYSVQKNFMRARDAMEERTLNMLCFGFHEHIFRTENLLQEIRRAQTLNDSSAAIIHTYMKNILQSKIATAGRAFQNYTQIYTAYGTGKPIFNYKFKKFSRKDNEAIVPKPLMNNSLTHNDYAKRYSRRMGKDIKRVMKWTQEFELFAEDVYKNSTDSFDLPRMHTLSAEFMDSCEDFFHSKSTFYFESVDRPLRIIQDRMLNFSSLRKDFERDVDEQFSALRLLKNSLSIIQSGLLYDLASGMTLAEQYFAENATQNVTKLQLAEVITSKSVSNDLHVFKLFFTDMRQKGQFIYQQWAKIKSDTLKILETIINDIDSVAYYQYKQMDDFLQNITDVDANLNSMLAALIGEYDLRNIMRNKDNAFIKAIDSLVEELRVFLQGNEMGEMFIRENFLQLGVYFKELRHEEIEQQRAYDAIALLCDIGGSIGLFIGASVLTLFEILDFFISNLCGHIIDKNKKR